MTRGSSAAKKQNPVTFGEQQAEFRRQAGMTQQRLAEATGINVWTLRGYEQNRREPNWKAALKVARALGVTVEAFADCTSLHDEDAEESPKPRKPTGRRRGRG
jgi:DNA-binding XRE family transcriptional regulator